MRYSLLISFLVLFLCACQEETKHKPIGFDYEAFEKDPNAKKYKQIYEEELYYTNGSTNVDSIRAIHMLNSAQRKQQRVSANKESFANGKIGGTWFERGPTNEAGDLREVDYDPTNDDLYVMSTAGNVFKGNLNGNSWEVINDKVRFNSNILNHVKKNGTDRLIAVYDITSDQENKIPRYSDDQGQTWTLATGFDNQFYDHWGSPKKMIELDGGRILYYLVQTWKDSPWGSAMEIYKSTDWGASYTPVLSAAARSTSFEDFDMWKPTNADVIYVVDNDDKRFYSISTNTNDGTHTISSGQDISGLGNGDVKVSGRYVSNNNVTFYALVDGYSVYKSTNGSSWSFKSDVSVNGDNVDIFRNVFIANPLNNDLYMGGFQFYKSADERNWTQQYSYWWTYYDENIPLAQRKDNLHVDMMEMEFFRKNNNTPFLIILNHAGIYVSYDDMKTTTNLGLNNLNVVTLYDHATAPDGTIYFGAQDKGTFFNNSNNNATTSMIVSQNTTTGDGMRELFFNNGKSWFGFLQNGDMVCKADKNQADEEYWQVPGNDIPGWINPVENHPDPAAKKCYVAGGNLNGGSGSYLILMEVSWTGNGDDLRWNPSQFNYDFKANSRDRNSVIKALSASTADYNRLYVATNDGTFFTSKDAGSSWTKSSYDIPNSLKPWDIIVSPTDADKVFLCGTGWDNTGVYFSTNAGQSFEALSTNAPQATYFDMVLSADEKILFAATSEGPYAYVFEDSKWYNIGGNSTPFVDYRSVEFIESIETVRFGTYGRGVWDFSMQERISSTEEVTQLTIQAYPNPFVDVIHISGIQQGLVKMYNETGKKVLEQSIETSIDTKNLPKGIYFLHVKSENTIYKVKLVK
ncbi:MAG: T9SS type A sorting domain-containing protein [Cytophagales bacterium]|nr:T9SS type A sorting domain-containing protein [Cytophagales bacterium]